MEWIAILKALVQPQSIYDAAISMSYIVAPIGGVILLLTVHLRVIETQYAGHGMGGGWSATIKSIITWSMVLGSYYALGSLIAMFANDLYEQFNKIGSIDLVIQQVDRFAGISEKKIQEQSQQSALSLAAVKTFGEDLLAVPGVIASGLIYKLTTLFAFSLTAFFRLVHALLFAGCFLLGLIIIPLNISEKLTMMRGWSVTVRLTLLWPIVESIIVGSAFLPFRNGLDKMFASSTHSAAWDNTNMMFVMSVFNILLILLQITALVLAAYIAMNAGSTREITAPFLSILSKLKR